MIGLGTAGGLGWVLGVLAMVAIWGGLWWLLSTVVFRWPVKRRTRDADPPRRSGPDGY